MYNEMTKKLGTRQRKKSQEEGIGRRQQVKEEGGRRQDADGIQ